MPAAPAPLRILVIHYRYIGDTVMLVPFLRNLRQAHPQARITWAHGPGDAEVLKGMPYVDEFLVWEPRKKLAHRPAKRRTLLEDIRFILALRRADFAKVYVLKRSLSSALLGYASGAPERIGFDTQQRGFLLTRRVPYRTDQHEVENLLDVLRADGISPADKTLELWLSPAERAFADDFLARHDLAPAAPLVALHPCANNAPRAWHEDDFAAVARELRQKHGASFIIFGGPADRPLTEALREKIGAGAVNIAGETRLRESIALLARCRLLVGNDSGVMHVGAALGLPIVAIFGPGSPARFGPWSAHARVVYQAFPCSPCRQKYFLDCTPSARAKPPCLETITVRQVLAAVDSLGVFVSPTT